MERIHNAFGRIASTINRAVSNPFATGLVFFVVAAWALSGPRLHYSNFWQLIMNTTSSVVTFLMVFVLNNAQNRDTAAINAKLDALILAVEQADNKMIGLERLPELEARAIQEEVHALKAVSEEAAVIHHEMKHEDRQKDVPPKE